MFSINNKANTFKGGLYRVHGHDADAGVCAGKHYGYLCRQRQVGTGIWQSVGINRLSL